jgi:histidinol-phosphate phosphatase family protein
MTQDNSTRCQVAILAGGMGTRLKSRTGGLPKPMVPVLGRPVLEHQIEMCIRHGFTRIALLVHYASDVIRDHFGDGSRFGVELTYCVETDARGTAGALRDALPAMASRFIVLYGDTYADVNLRALWDDHSRSGASGTLLLHPNDHPHDSDLVEVDGQLRVVAVRPYPHPEGAVYANLVNAALYVLEREGLAEAILAEGRSDLAKHTFPTLLVAGRLLHAFVTPEYIKDMGTPERLDKVERDIVAGLPERLSDRHARTAVFLDRDGTLNVEVQHLSQPSQLRLIDGAGDAVRALNRAGVLAVGVTNQPVVARGDVTWETLDRIHATLDHLLGDHKAWLDRMYVCPHHPHSGFAGEVRELKIPCDCRKPEAGLIDRAVRELRISRRHSWIVGDTSSDMLAGARAGLRTVLVRTGHAGQDGKVHLSPDYIVPDLASAVDWILRGHAAVAAQVRDLVARAADSRIVLIGGPARAGKSSVAQVLAEQLETGALNAHVVSLDGWLKPVEQRREGDGVLERYDMAAVLAWLQPVLERPGSRHRLDVPNYNRKTRASTVGCRLLVAPRDILILEGVPALLEPFLVASSAVRIFVDIDENQRRRRLQADYAWRDVDTQPAMQRLDSREQDELPLVRASAMHATDRIESSGE